jgi:hypothetical protein
MKAFILTLFGISIFVLPLALAYGVIQPSVAADLACLQDAGCDSGYVVGKIVKISLGVAGVALVYALVGDLVYQSTWPKLEKGRRRGSRMPPKLTGRP